MKRTGRRGVIPEWSFVDLPAESFIRQTHEDGFPNLAKATNDIVDGIRSITGTASEWGHLLILAA